MNNNWHKKEKPLLGLTGLGGGVDGLGVVGAGEKFYIDDYFKWSLWQGNNTIGRDIVNNIDIADKGGMVWAKKRELEDHIIVDTVRGANNFLIVNDSDAQSTANSISAFNSNGFTVDNNGYVNGNSSTYVGWTFAKQKGFFDVVTWTGNGTAGREIAHNLGSLPGMIIVKRTDGADDWYTANLRADGAQYNFCKLNTTDAKFSNDLIANVADASNIIVDGTSNGGTGSFANLDGGAHTINTTGETYVAYVFAHNDGDGTFGKSGNQDIIKCSTYSGNNSSTGPTVTLGWEPQYLLIKRVDGGSGGQWTIFDSGRGVHTGSNDEALYANNNDAETNYEYLEFNSTGFQLKTTSGDVNASATYLYVAIRRPDGYVGKPAEAGTDVFNVVAGNSGGGTDTTAVYIPGFALDFALQRRVTTTFNTDAVSRLTGSKYLYTNTNGAEQNYNPYVWDYSDGWCSDASANSNFYSWMWKRGQGFDVVAYTGNGTGGHQISHSMNKTPEMIWVKNRDEVQGWRVYHKGLNGGTNPEQYRLILNLDSTESSSSTAWNDTSPTSSTFTLGTDNAVNENNKDHIAMLFASVAGISKVGSFTGNGTSQSISLGFQPRFLILKNATSAEKWYVLDTVRGWNSTSDAYISLNTDYAEVSSNIFGEPTATGFDISGSDNWNNANGETFVYYAHA